MRIKIGMMMIDNNYNNVVKDLHLPQMDFIIRLTTYLLTFMVIYSAGYCSDLCGKNLITT